MFVRTSPFLGSWVWLFPVLLWHSQTQPVYMYNRKSISYRVRNGKHKCIRQFKLSFKDSKRK